jgi:hypothetical protein
MSTTATPTAFDPRTDGPISREMLEGFADTSAIVGFVALLGAIVTITTLPEPKGQSLEELTEEGERPPTSAVALGLAHSRGVRPPPG